MNDKTTEILYRLRLNAPPDRVFDLLATNQGRASFWAERTEQHQNEVTFFFPNGEKLASRVTESSSPLRFSLTYFNDSNVTFSLREHLGGTELQLRETGVLDTEVCENRAGWVSVLLNLKAQADHGIDLRNHDPQHTWSEGYVDN